MLSQSRDVLQEGAIATPRLRAQSEAVGDWGLGTGVFLLVDGSRTDLFGDSWSYEKAKCCQLCLLKQRGRQILKLLPCSNLPNFQQCLSLVDPAERQWIQVGDEIKLSWLNSALYQIQRIG